MTPKKTHPGTSRKSRALQVVAAAAPEVSRDQDRFRWQSAMADFAKRSVATHDAADLTQCATELLARGLNLEFTQFSELLVDGGSLLLTAGTGWLPGYVGSRTVETGNGSQAGYTVAKGEITVVEDGRSETRFDLGACLREHSVISGVTVLVQCREGAIAVLGVHTSKPRLFLADEVQFLKGMANALALALDTLRTTASVKIREQRVSALTESSRNSMVLIAADGVIQYATPGTYTALGYEADEFLGGKFLDRVHPSDCQAFTECLDTFPHRLPQSDGEAAAETPGYDIAVRFRFRHRDGSWRWMDGTLSRLLTQPATHALVCSFRDITESKLADDLMRSRESHHALILRSVPIALYTARANGPPAISWVSETVQELTGFPSTKFTHDPLFWVSRMHPDDREGFLTEFHRSTTSGLTGCEYRWRTADGTYRWFLDRSTLVCDPQGRPKELFGTWLDISDRHKSEDRLRASKEQLRLLAGRIQNVREVESTRIAREIHDELGHDLTALKLDIAWLKTKLDRDQAPLLKRTRSMLRQVDVTIEKVRRIASDLRPPVLDDLGLVAAVEWQARDFQRRTKIRCRFIAEVEELEIGPDRCTAAFRIVQEALTNVARHSAATHVKIQLSVDELYLHLSVNDDGVGISEPNRADSRALGLLGMSERAMLVGGDVTISGKPGVGTTVALRIPLVV